MIQKRPGSRRPRPDKKVIPLYGKDEDNGRYFICWNCGYVCDKDRDAYGGRGDGISVKFSTPTAQGDNGDPLSVISVLRGPVSNYQTAMENGADGQPKAIRQMKQPDVTGGCPLCGTLNWK